MTKTVGRYKNLFMGKELYEECGFWTLEELTQRGLLSKEVDESSLLVCCSTNCFYFSTLQFSLPTLTSCTSDSLPLHSNILVSI